MSFLNRLLGRDTEPKTRIRVCIECGMPVDAHKDWCAIFRTQLEMDQKREGSSFGPAATPGVTG